MGSEAVLFHSWAPTPQVAQQHFLDLGFHKMYQIFYRSISSFLLSLVQMHLSWEPCIDTHARTHTPSYIHRNTFLPFFLEKGTPLSSPGWPGTSYIALAGLKVRDQLASTFQVLGLKKCSTMPNSP